MKSRQTLTALAVLVLGGILAACSPGASAAGTVDQPAAEAAVQTGNGGTIAGDIIADGSSTIYPITVAVAEEFQGQHPDARVSVGLSGTGGGFEKFCRGETDIQNASRPIKDEESANCDSSGVEYTEFLVALDGLTVMVNPQNDWLECLSQEQLAALFGADSEVVSWADLDPSYPDEEILFFIPDPDSGTRDYMAEIVEGISGATDLRQDANTTTSSDDNVLLDGIANEPYALGFFGYAYYVNNQTAVRAVAIENDAGECVLPSDETVQNGTYNPLSRPLFIYVNNNSLREKRQVAEFVRFYLSDVGAPAIMSDVGYSLPPDGTYAENVSVLEQALGQ